MNHIASLWRHTGETARILRLPTIIKYKALWLETHVKAMSCRCKGLVAHDKSLREQLFHKQLWYQGIYSEVEWWRQWLATNEGQEWLEVVQDPYCPVQDYLIVELVQSIENYAVNILDVGSGPITHIGYTVPGKRLEITAVDPISDAYNRMLKQLRVTTPVNTAKCFGELLLDSFEPESFDVVYASNSLDHSYDPLAIIDNMISVVKRDRFVLLRHYRNEGMAGKYHGLHQWNFDVIDGDLIIWNETEQYNITRRVADKARVECRIEDTHSHGVFDYNDWVVAVFRRL